MGIILLEGSTNNWPLYYVISTGITYDVQPHQIKCWQGTQNIKTIPASSDDYQAIKQFLEHST